MADPVLVNWVPQSRAFKDNPTATGMRNYILDSVTKKRHPVPRCITVWDEDQDDEEDGGRRGAQGGSRGQQSVPSHSGAGPSSI